MKGAITALTIPFKDNKLETTQLTEHVNSLIKDGIDGFSILTTTGQGPLLTREERIKVISVVKENAQNKYLIVQVGGSNWDTIVSTIKEAEKQEATAILTMPPIYYKPDYETIRIYLTKISTLTSLPLYIYNAPRFTGFDMTSDIINKLLQDKIKIAGISDSVPDMIEIMGHINLGIEVFSGLEPMIYSTIMMGGKGCASTFSNAIPELIVSIYKNIINGNIEEARKTQMLIYNLYSLIGKYPYPAIQYSLVKLLRYDFGSVKEPLVRALSEEEEKTLKKELRELGFMIRE